MRLNDAGSWVKYGPLYIKITAPKKLIVCACYIQKEDTYAKYAKK